MDGSAAIESRDPGRLDQNVSQLKPETRPLHTEIKSERICSEAGNWREDDEGRFQKRKNGTEAEEGAVCHETTNEKCQIHLQSTRKVVHKLE